MADFEDVKIVEVPVTTLMKIVKHCRENGNDEALGVIMGTNVEGTCFIGNCFPHHSKKSIIRKSTDAHTKKTIVDKAVEHFEKMNYDNNVCGIYVNVPSGKLFSTDFMLEILKSNTYDMLNDAKIIIAYERALAELGMNPFTAFKFSPSFIENVKSKKFDKIFEDKIEVEKLDMKIFRSSFDQAFLAEYVCPEMTAYTNNITEDVSMSEIC
jgi:hypothetical protein